VDREVIVADFVVGQTYSRDEIHEKVGGDKQNMMPTVGRRLVCCCLIPEKNPKGPSTLLIRDHYATASQWANDGHDVPVFVKRAVNHWEYIGQYHVGRATEDPKDMAAEAVDKLPKIVLYLERRNEA
jgi:hypothetical protein